MTDRRPGLSTPPRSRRRALRGGALAVAAIAAGGALVPVRRAAAGSAAPVLIGEVNDGDTATTTLTSGPPSGATLHVLNPGTGIALNASGERGGVYGTSENAVGVYAAGVPGLRATTALEYDRRDARAIEVWGRAAFTSAGMLRIPAGEASATATGLNVPRGSLILATVQGRRRRTWVVSARRIDDKTIRVSLNRAGVLPVRVAFFVLEHARARR